MQVCKEVNRGRGVIGIPTCFASVVLLAIDDPGVGKWSKIGVQEMNTGNNNVEGEIQAGKLAGTFNNLCAS